MLLLFAVFTGGEEGVGFGPDNAVVPPVTVNLGFGTRILLPLLTVTDPCPRASTASAVRPDTGTGTES